MAGFGLTSVGQPMEALGIAAAELAIQRATNPGARVESRIMAPAIAVRNSSAGPTRVPVA